MACAGSGLSCGRYRRTRTGAVLVLVRVVPVSSINSTSEPGRAQPHHPSSAIYPVLDGAFAGGAAAALVRACHPPSGAGWWRLEVEVEVERLDATMNLDC